MNSVLAHEHLRQIPEATTNLGRNALYRMAADARLMPSHIIPVARLVLVLVMILNAGLALTLISHSLDLSAALIGLYFLFSVLIFSLTALQNPFAGRISAWEHWADLSWILGIMLSNMESWHAFLPAIFFPLLVAAFRWGFASALRVTAAAGFAFAVLGALSQKQADSLFADHGLIPPIITVILGYMVAYWGGFEILLNRRLSLLAEVTRMANPRFGTGKTIACFMDRLRSFYDAEVCLLVMAEPGTSEMVLRRCDRSNPAKGARAEYIPAEMLSRLLALPSEAAIAYQGQAGKRIIRPVSFFEYDVVRGIRTASARLECEQLASSLDADSLVTVPVRYRQKTIGRLYLAARHQVFEETDIFFIMQVLDQVLPIVDNIRLLDRMALDAGFEERKKIARNLHDSVIQPNIGVRLGLASLKAKLAGGTLAEEDIDRLLEMNDGGIAELRGHISFLRNKSEQERDLISAVRRFCESYSEATGILVDIETQGEVSISGRLAAEAFQIVVEGLSNVRRHTESMRAKLTIACAESHLILRIWNDGNGGVSGNAFQPHSIMERAEALGGTSVVECRGFEGTTVLVTIPV